MFYSFYNYKLDTCSHELLHQGEVVKIKPLIYKLLIYLLENPDRVLSRDELIRHVWNSRIISDSSISAAISNARHAIGDSGTRQKIIKTVSSYGYRFIAPLTCQNTTKADFTSLIQIPASELTCDDNPALLPLPDKPSIAMMDLVSLDTSQKGKLLAYGLTVEINAGLSRLPHLFVIARASSAYVSQQQLLPVEIRKKLGVRYLIYGYTKTVNKRFQMTLSLVDSLNNTEIWSEHFNEPYDDILIIQNKALLDIVTIVNRAVEKAEIERSFLVPTENLNAWENYYRGSWYMMQSSFKAYETAQKFLQQAISQDSRFSRAYASLSFTYINHIYFNSTENEDDMLLKKASDCALLSLRYNQAEPMAYFSMARVLWLSKQHEKSLLLCNQGLAININNTNILSIKTVVTGLSCHDDQAKQDLETVKRLSPYDPLLFTMNGAVATSLVHQNKYKEAVYYIKKATNDPNACYMTYAVAAALLNLADHPKQAQHHAKHALKLQPTCSIKNYQRLMPHTDKTTRNIIIKSMHSAGIPLR